MKNEIKSYLDIIARNEKLKGVEKLIKEFIDTANKLDCYLIHKDEIDFLFNRIDELNKRYEKEIKNENKEKPELKIGSTVVLKSGSPIMTVANINKENAVTCGWFDGGDYKYERFWYDELIEKEYI